MIAPTPWLAARVETGGLRWADLPPAWVLVLVVAGLLFVALALYRRERGRASRGGRWLLAGLRTLALVLLVLVLAGPYREEVLTAEERSHLVLLVDTSASMRTQDRHPPAEAAALRETAWPDGEGAPEGEGLEASRLDLVRATLTAQDAALLRRLDERFIVHAFAFDEDWRSLGTSRVSAPEIADADAPEDPVADLAAAIDATEAKGGRTRLAMVLRNVASEFLDREDRRLAGVLLLSDGRDISDGESPLEVVAGLGASRTDLHVTPVGLGNPASGRNVSVDRIRAKDVVLIGDEVVFETDVRHQGFTGLEDVRAEMAIERVADADGEPVEPTPYTGRPDDALAVDAFTLGPEDEAHPVRMRAHFDEPGTFRVEIGVVLPPEAAELDAVQEDDVAVHEIRVVDQRIRILYVDDIPRYDWRFLSNYLTREPVDDAGRPDRRRRYEAHILLQSGDPTVDQPASPGLEPLRAFPRTRRELFEYDVIILGDVDWMRLGATPEESREILGLLREFVDEGGGLAVQSGEQYNAPLGFRDTPLQELLPVTLRDRDETLSGNKDRRFRIALTDAGRRHPIFGIVPGRDGGLAQDPDEVAAVWAGEAPVSRRWAWWWTYRPTGGLRPGAIDLARVKPEGPMDRTFLDDRGRPLVLFATMGYGKGRTFWTGLDTLSRLRREQGDRIFGAFWDQVIRYLATYRLLGGNKRFKISTERDTYFKGETATVTITALDRDYEPLADAWLDGVHVETPRGESVLLTGDDRPRNVAQEGAQPGTYRFHLPIRTSGTYRVWIRDEGAGPRAGSERAELRIEARFRAPELRQTLPDHDTLARIAAATDGQLVDGRVARLPDLAGLADAMPSRTVERILDRRERTQWDRSWVLFLLVGVLGLEWFLRKRFQMI